MPVNEEDMEFGTQLMVILDGPAGSREAYARVVKCHDAIANYRESCVAAATADLRAEVDALTKARDRLKEAIEKSFYRVGHDDDCLFCGFKDKIAREALAEEAQ